MSNPGYCPDCKESGWACRCGREPLPTTTVTDGVEALREHLRVLMLEQPHTEERESYSDGFASGLLYAIQQIDKLPARPQPEGVEALECVPCPLCKQYSHSIPDDKLAAAFRHFQTLIAHPMRGHPMGEAFDEQTRDAAQVLMAAARHQPEGVEDLVERLRETLALLTRYRNETPPGHSPHMICHQADAAIAKAGEALARLGGVGDE